MDLEGNKVPGAYSVSLLHNLHLSNISFSKKSSQGPELRNACQNLSGPIFFTGSRWNQQIDAKKTARCRRVLEVMALFNIATSEFHANMVKKSACCRRELVLSELDVSGTQWN